MRKNVVQLSQKKRVSRWRLFSGTKEKIET
jgi:hypothetical protein